MLLTMTLRQANCLIAAKVYGLSCDGASIVAHPSRVSDEPNLRPALVADIRIRISFSSRIQLTFRAFTQSQDDMKWNDTPSVPSAISRREEMKKLFL